MKKLVLLFCVSSVLLMACPRNPVTGRRQLKLVDEGQLQQMALQQYSTFLSQNKVVPATNSNTLMVKKVGERIATAITKYYEAQGKPEVLNGYKWEFNLVDSKEINAWCMPGGKVVVYTGLLNVTKTEEALAIVMGHEIAHAIAKHGSERMSQTMLAEGIAVVGDVATSNNPKTNQIFNSTYGIGANVGVLLPNSRSQESEADRFGLYFAAMAGYNPEAAIAFWQRMAAASNGQKPPEFLSTHPSDETRIQKLKEIMPEALKYYKPQ